MLADSLLLLKTDDMLKLKTFLENFNLQFVEEQHQNGIKHYACQKDNFVLEIYSLD